MRRYETIGVKGKKPSKPSEAKEFNDKEASFLIKTSQYDLLKTRLTQRCKELANLESQTSRMTEFQHLHILRIQAQRNLKLKGSSLSEFIKEINRKLRLARAPLVNIASTSHPLAEPIVIPNAKSQVLRSGLSHHAESLSNERSVQTRNTRSSPLGLRHKPCLPREVPVRGSPLQREVFRRWDGNAQVTHEGSDGKFANTQGRQKHLHSDTQSVKEQNIKHGKQLDLGFDPRRRLLLTPPSPLHGGAKSYRSPPPTEDEDRNDEAPSVTMGNQQRFISLSDNVQPSPARYEQKETAQGDDLYSKRDYVESPSHVSSTPPSSRRHHFDDLYRELREEISDLKLKSEDFTLTISEAIKKINEQASAIQQIEKAKEEEIMSIKRHISKIQEEIFDIKRLHHSGMTLLHMVTDHQVNRSLEEIGVKL